MPNPTDLDTQVKDLYWKNKDGDFFTLGLFVKDLQAIIAREVSAIDLPKRKHSAKWDNMASQEFNHGFNEAVRAMRVIRDTRLAQLKAEATNKETDNG